MQSLNCLTLIGMLVVGNVATADEPKTAREFSDRAAAFYEKKQYEKAIADCNEAVRLDPKDAFTFIVRGRCYHELMSYEKAVADFDESLKLKPGNQSVKEQKEKAVKALQSAGK